MSRVYTFFLSEAREGIEPHLVDGCPISYLQTTETSLSNDHVHPVLAGLSRERFVRGN